MSLYPSLEGLTIGKEIEAQENLGISSETFDDDQKTESDYAALARKFLGDYWNSIDPISLLPSSEPNSEILSPSNHAPENKQQISHMIREIELSHKPNEALGLQLRNLDTGVFVSFVEHGSPASKAGLRFGDQILRVNDKFVAGLKGKEVLNYINKKCGLRISIIIRERLIILSFSSNIYIRPLERVVTLTKDSFGNIGILLCKGSIEKIVQGSSAERNGVLINCHVCEINGVNVLGMSDDTIRDLIKMSGITITLTLIPNFFYECLTKRLDTKHFREMDRSQPKI